MYRHLLYPKAPKSLRWQIALSLEMNRNLSMHRAMVFGSGLQNLVSYLQNHCKRNEVLEVHMQTCLEIIWGNLQNKLETL